MTKGSMWISSTAFLASLILLTSAGARAANITSDMAAYWQFDEGIGQQAADVSGNEKHATLGASGDSDDNDPTWTTEGPTGHSLLFEGNDYLLTPNVFDIGTGPVSIALAFKQTETADFQYLLANKSNFDNNFFRVGFNNNDGRLRVYSEEDGGANTYFITSDAYTDEWHHLVVTREGSVGRLYVDGAHLTDFTTMGGDLGTATDQWILGQGGTGGFFRGYMTEVRVYGRALSADDVADLYGTVVPEPSTLLLTAVSLFGLAFYGWRRRR